MALAVLAASGTLFGAIGAPARLICPPGTTNPAYCVRTKPPRAVTLGATRGKGRSGVVLSGEVITYRESVEWYFQYGTTASYGKATAAKRTARTTNVRAEIGGVKLSTVYHYRLVIKYAGGAAVGKDHSLKVTKPRRRHH